MKIICQNQKQHLREWAKPTQQRVVSYAPSHCNFNQLCRITRDHFDAGDFTVMTDGSLVWLSEQKMGHERTQNIEIPRPVFNKLIRWYLRPQVALRS